MNTDTKRLRPDMTSIELQYYNVMMANMASTSIAKSLKKLTEVVKSIQNSTVKMSCDTETK